MKKSNVKKSSAAQATGSVVAGLCTAILFAAGTLLPAKAEWFLEAGPLYRGHMKISVEGGSHAANRGAGPQSGSSGAFPSGMDGPLLNDDGLSAVLR
ncbi:MAG: hypothetical protein U1E27_05040, partial [Kiritimatiellia bacterium]|nr:hypothetical protein [Kiritimatiellia bacterium]